MKNVLVISTGIFHPAWRARAVLRRMLATMDGFSFTYLPSFEPLLDLANLGRFHALVIYLHRQTISPQALAIFDRFVANGGGVLGIHSATASFKDAAHYFEIIGGKFAGHGPIETFCADPVGAGHSPLAGLPSFTVTDELYLHDLQPGLEVQFQTLNKGEPVPIVWTRNYGAGKVCYAVPGHCVETMQNTAYQQVLRRGLAWVAG